MIGWKLGQTAPMIGVDVGRHSVKLVQFDRPGADGRVVACVAQPLPAGASLDDEAYRHGLASAVKSALSRGPFTGKRCVSALPPAAFEAKNLRLPTMPADELRDAVDWEVRDRLKAGPDELSVQYLHAGQVRQGDEVREEVIALAARNAAVETHVQALCEAGLAPVAVEVSVSALARLFTEDELAGVSVVVDVGEDCSRVVILRDRHVVFFKTIDVAGAAFDQAVARQVSMPVEETRQLRGEFTPNGNGNATDSARRALAEALRGPVTELSREIELCLRYFGVTFRGARPETLTLVGVEADQPWLADMLAEQSGLGVKVGDPTRGADGGGPSWAVAAGLALRPEETWGERRRAGRDAA